MIPIDPLIARVDAALTPRGVGWAIAGGWAIDAFLGRVTRPHDDVDIAVWRDEQHALRDALSAWRFAVADSGNLRPWPVGTLIDPPLHELHAEVPEGDASVEFLLNDRDGGEWVYRRDRSIRLAVPDAIVRNGAFPCLAPEVVLLYKSKVPRPIDGADLLNVLPLLTPSAREWIANALKQIDPIHPWLPTIDAL